MIDFFGKQEKLKIRTSILVILFLLSAFFIASLATVTTMMLLPRLFINFGDFYNPYEVDYSITYSLFQNTHYFITHLSLERTFKMIGIFMAVMTVMSIIEVIRFYMSGGSKIAESLSGYPINPRSTVKSERQLFNIVEEMAIAAGLPVPPVYILRQEKSINAFAAGNNIEDAVIGVTKGALNKLSRNEMQGIIAHEFSHIANGDMTINIRLLGILAGILSISSIGFYILGIKDRSRREMPTPKWALFAIGLIIVGYAGYFLGLIIKAIISRKRELLADVTALQYTRHSGILDALLKIASQGSKLKTSESKVVSHIFFAEGVTHYLLASHPSIRKRIANLLGKKTKEIPKELDLVSTDVSLLPSVQNSSLGMMSGDSTPTNHLDTHFLELAKEMMGANVIIYLLLLHPERNLAEGQLKDLERNCAPLIFKQLQKYFHDGKVIEKKSRFSFLQVALGSLKEMSPTQKEELMTNVKQLIHADNQVDLFEFILADLIWRHLRKKGWKDVSQLFDIKQKESACYVLSILAKCGHDDFEKAKQSYSRGRNLILKKRMKFPNLFNWCDNRFASSLQSLRKWRNSKKQRFLEACITVVKHDAKITPEEFELIQAISLSLGLAIPASFFIAYNNSSS